MSLRHHDRWFRRLRFLTRIRYQLIGATLFAIVLPAVLRNGLNFSNLRLGSLENAVIGTFGAMLIGAYLLHRMTIYPGTRVVPYVLPTFLLSYGVAIALFFFLRLDYSRSQFVTSFFFVILWFGSVGLIAPRLRRLSFLVLPIGAAKKVMISDRADWAILQSSDELPLNSSGIIADFRAEISPVWERFLARAALAGIPVYHWKQITESLTGLVEIEHLSENSLGGLMPSSIYLRFKGLVDSIGAILCLPLVALIAIPAAIAIRLFDGGPILFRQTRVGLGGRPFTVLKFRTMYSDHDQSGHFTKPNDPRITPLGKFLRRYRIDELPQIINILRGEMSWVGPRPEAVELAKWYENKIPFYSYRHIVKPGISGWAQVHQGNVAEIEAATSKLQYDFYYIKHFSPWLDILIAAKTVQIVLTGYGAR